MFQTVSLLIEHSHVFISFAAFAISWPWPKLLKLKISANNSYIVSAVWHLALKVLIINLILSILRKF